MSGVELPRRPSCFPREGKIKCALTCDSDCVRARQFWLAAKTCAEMPTDAARRSYIGMVSTTKGMQVAAQIRQAAWQLIREARS
jgi:hypothetical protein